MIKKLFSVSDEVANVLEREPNQSALVDALLHTHYGIEPTSEVAQSRKEILARISADGEPDLSGSVLANLPEDEVIIEPPEVTVIPAPVMTDLSPQPDPLATLVDEIETLEAPVQVEVVAEAPIVTVVEAPVEPAATSETVPEYLPGSKVCPTCGNVMTTDICINCL